MTNILIAFETRDGQCEKIAHSVADVVRCLGHSPTIENVDNLHDPIIMSRYDAVIFGGPIHVGSHSKTLRRFVETNRVLLKVIPTAFFSVSLSAAGAENQRKDAYRCMHAFLSRAEFVPLDSIILAGAVKYRKYSLFKRLMMKWIVASAGGDTDTSQDYEYTNWIEVSRFVERFLAKAGIEVFPHESVAK